MKLENIDKQETIKHLPETVINTAIIINAYDNKYIELVDNRIKGDHFVSVHNKSTDQKYLLYIILMR